MQNKSSTVSEGGHKEEGRKEVMAIIEDEGWFHCQKPGFDPRPTGQTSFMFMTKQRPMSSQHVCNGHRCNMSVLSLCMKVIHTETINDIYEIHSCWMSDFMDD